MYAHAWSLSSYNFFADGNYPLVNFNVQSTYQKRKTVVSYEMFGHNFCCIGVLLYPVVANQRLKTIEKSRSPTCSCIQQIDSGRGHALSLCKGWLLREVLTIA